MFFSKFYIFNLKYFIFDFYKAIYALADIKKYIFIMYYN